MTKFLIDEYEDSPAQQYAIGTTQLAFYPKLSFLYLGIKATYTYLWDIDDQDSIDATLSFQNWVPSKTISDV